MECEVEKALKSRTALRRCAKAALLLHRLKSLHGSTNNDGQEEMLKNEIHDLKMELLKERLKNNKVKLSALLELLLQLLLLLSLWTFFLVLFHRAR